MAGVFLSLRRVLPNRYPLAFDVERYIADEQRLGQLLELVRDGNPIYAWPYEDRHVWRSRQMPFAGRVLAHLTRASNQTGASRAWP